MTDTAAPGSIAARKALRRLLRDRRRALTDEQRRTASRAATAHIARTSWLRPGRRIGLYLSLDEEISTAPLIALAEERGCKVYVPRVHNLRTGRMTFVRARAPWRMSRLGILEPVGHERCPVRALDIVFVPLVGFDAHGNRMGMGAGFYDRALAFRRLRLTWHRPLLAGFALACQELPEIPHAPHDVPLDVMVTERGVHYVRLQPLP